MNNRRTFLVGFTAITGFALSGCEKLKKTAEDAAILLNPGKGRKRWPNYRYRLTVEVDTPEGVKTGSSVIEVETAMSGPNNISSPGSLYLRARGEAVTVDLGEQGLLFALLRSESKEEDWASGALMTAVPRRTPDELQNLPEGTDRFSFLMDRLFTMRLDQAVLFPRQIETGRWKDYKPVMIDNYPMLVRFDDLARPETVKRVEPDKMESSFGQGVKLKSVTIERTESSVTKSLEKQLPWLEPVGRQRATLIPNPPRYLKDVNDPAIQLLSPSAFSSELYK